MDDALEEMREGTRNLHIELLRQFHFQQVRASACGCGWSLQRRAASLQCGGAAPTPYATAGGEATLVQCGGSERRSCCCCSCVCLSLKGTVRGQCIWLFKALAG